MKINREELQEILTKLRPGLAKRETVEQATHFIFTGEEIVTFNDQICIHYPFKSDFEFSVKADEFYKIISTLPDFKLKLSLEENILKLDTQTTRAGLSIVVDPDHMVVELVEKVRETIGEWKSLPENFIQGMYLCLFSASKDAQKGPLVCISIANSSIVSCDNYRASIFHLDESANLDSFLIHSRDAAELVKFPDIREYSVSDNWTHFKNKDGVMFSARKFWDEYKNISSVFEFDYDNSQKITLPKELKDIVSSCAVMAGGDIDAERHVKLSFKNGWVTCSSEKDIGWIQKTIEVDYKGKLIEFNVNPSFFSQVLEKVTTMFYEGREKVAFVSEGFLHVLALNISSEEI